MIPDVEHNVIDNQEVRLRDELLKVLPHCKAAAFALGYFFLSGYREIHEPVSHLPKVRILTSGNTNQETVDAILGAYKSLDAARRELDRRQIINLETPRSRRRARARPSASRSRRGRRTMAAT